MKKIIKSFVVILTLASGLSACGTFFDKDNTPAPTPLTDFKPAVTINTHWNTYTGPGAGSDYLKLSPALANNTIFTASYNGTVTAIDKVNGKKHWSIRTNSEMSGGAAANDNLVFVGTREGELLALEQTDGKLIWKTHVSSEILAPAASNNKIVLVKAIDGQITALAANDGHVLWHYQETAPSLILRGSSAPQMTRASAVVGFEDGGLVKLSQNGNVQWQEAIAQPTGIFAIQRMVDIDADPIIVGSRVFAATYQGNIAALDLATGKQLWSQTISSFAGIASDGETVYVSDAQSHLWAFNARKGDTAWIQNKLIARNITGPAIIGNYIVVGDAQGYLHWMSKQDGHFVARTYVSRSGILATPIVDNNLLYVYTKDGHLAAYSVIG